jgi:hypothetical protein
LSSLAILPLYSPYALRGGRSAEPAKKKTPAFRK